MSVLDRAGPKERNGVLGGARLLNVGQVLPPVVDISVHDEWRRIDRRLEGAVGRLEASAEDRPVLNAQSLHFLTCHRVLWSVLPKELRVGHGAVVESLVVVQGAVKELTRS